jgi:hypothetical protein
MFESNLHHYIFPFRLVSDSYSLHKATPIIDVLTFSVLNYFRSDGLRLGHSSSWLVFLCLKTFSTMTSPIVYNVPSVDLQTHCHGQVSFHWRTSLIMFHDECQSEYQDVYAWRLEIWTITEESISRQRLERTGQHE